MKQLHELDIVHRDLAARNVLVFAFDRERHLAISVKVSDFGLSRHVPESQYYGMGNIVPIRWMPPEALERRIFSEKSDVWAFGVTLWEIFTRCQLPYMLMPNDRDVITAVLAGERLPKPASCSQAIYDSVVQHCWQASPDQRATFAKLVPILRALQEKVTVGPVVIDMPTCVICLEERATVAAVPCGHMCYCATHARDMQARGQNLCPIDRQPVERFITVYFP